MNKIDVAIKDLETRLKDDPQGLQSLNELVLLLGSLEGEIVSMQMEMNRRSWDGYVDQMSGAFTDREVADHYRSSW